VETWDEFTTRLARHGLTISLDAARAAQDVAGRETGSVSVSVVMPSGHKHTLSHVADYDSVQHWDCGDVRIAVEDGHLVTVESLDVAAQDVAGRYESPPEGMVTTGTSWHDGAHTGCDLDYEHRHAIWQPATPPPDALREALEAIAEIHEGVHPTVESARRCRDCYYSRLLSRIEAALRAQGVAQSPETLASSVTPQEVHDAMTLAGVGCNGTHSLGYATCQTIARALLTPVDESRDPHRGGTPA
jgi:hypothetical protein